jgi:hypothetical protein
MTRRWFVTGQAGAVFLGFVQRLVGQGADRRGLQATGSLGLGFNQRSHSVFIQQVHGVGDTYGLAGQNDDSSLSWSWSPRAGRWSFTNSGGYSRSEITGYSEIRGWRANSDLSRQLRRDLRMNLRYGHVWNAGRWLEGTRRFTYREARLSVTWSPTLRPR